MCLPVKFRCSRSDCIVLSVHHMLYKVHSVFLTWCTAPPGICLPCLTGHLTLLSLRLCCHGNSSVTGPGWAWGMSCGEMARFLQQRERGEERGGWGGGGRGEASKARQEMVDGKLGGLWHGRGGAGVFTPLSASRHVVLVLFRWPQISQAIYLCWG